MQTTELKSPLNRNRKVRYGYIYCANYANARMHKKLNTQGYAKGRLEVASDSRQTIFVSFFLQADFFFFFFL